ncbi:MAG: hypothetical protein HY457_02875 [Parcubacteria group bacterium]|nr:hypothetical protein [Parcubacteria group bacterium]
MTQKAVMSDKRTRAVRYLNDNGLDENEIKRRVVAHFILTGKVPVRDTRTFYVSYVLDGKKYSFYVGARQIGRIVGLIHPKDAIDPALESKVLREWTGGVIAALLFVGLKYSHVKQRAALRDKRREKRVQNSVAEKAPVPVNDFAESL